MMKTIGKKAGSLLFWGILLAAAIFLLNSPSAFAGPASEGAGAGAGRGPAISAESSSGTGSAAGQVTVVPAETAQAASETQAAAVIQAQETAAPESSKAPENQTAGAGAAASETAGNTEAGNTETGETEAEAEPEKPVILLTADVTSCVLTDASNIRVTLTSNGGDPANLAGTDGNIYLFELESWQTSAEGLTPLKSAAASGNLSWSIPRSGGRTGDRLYNAFAAGIKTEEGYQLISNRRYVENPEILATDTSVQDESAGKKGLNIELDMMADATSLGVRHVAVNIAFHQIRGTGIEYTFRGKTYHFNKGVVEKYDNMVSRYTEKGLTITAIVMNGWNPSTPNMYLPGTSKQSNRAYYTYHATTKDGFDELEAMASFLAERYNGHSGHGLIRNWVIGNEINNQYWNHAGAYSLEDYVNIYQRAFRVFYTAIKSRNSGDEVMFSIDFNWNQPVAYNSERFFSGRQILDEFNRQAHLEGNMDWALAYHPYPHPLTDPVFWNDGNDGLTQDASSRVVNFYNLHVLTDYLCQAGFKNSKGQVRSVFLTEQGFSSTTPSGERCDLQAAAFAYSYYIVDSNPYIKVYILSRQIDAPEEVVNGLSFGLWYCNMTHMDRIEAYHKKQIYDVFKLIDKPQYTLQATEFAKPLLGINKWSDVIPGFRWSGKE